MCMCVCVCVCVGEREKGTIAQAPGEHNQNRGSNCTSTQCKHCRHLYSAKLIIFGRSELDRIFPEGAD